MKAIDEAAPEGSMTGALIRPRLLVSIFLMAVVSAALPALARDWSGFTQKGQATYYADKFQNRKTASGELYQHKLKTAAHKKLPFGTRVRVKNVDNGKTVVVRINDRGPFAKKRIIDLSRSAFDSIGDVSAGVLNVEIEVIR